LWKVRGGEKTGTENMGTFLHENMGTMFSCRKVEGKGRRERKKGKG
jgi:hypothetical protein